MGISWKFSRWINRKHGDDPKDSDLNAFHHISNSESQLEGYRNQTAQLALNFLETSFAHEAKGLETLYAAKANNEIRSARPGFCKGVSQGIVSSGLFTLLIGCLVFFTWSLKQGPRQVIEQVFDVMIVDAAPANTAIMYDPGKSLIQKAPHGRLGGLQVRN